MTFDCSRFPFDPWNDYFGVVLQQGRVQLDSDWNECLSELARRIQAGTMDTVGRAVYPATTPYGFKINASVDTNNLQHVTIGAGRMYVDGLLAENHGLPASVQWDPSLAELSCTAPGAAEVEVDFTQQPYYPGAALPSGNGPFLAYLDVWRRPVTYLNDPSLVEVAVGVDTTGRMQTVWQVNLLDVSSVTPGVTCATPDSDIATWEALIQPSAGRLTTGVVPSAQTGPCALSPATGYTGLENQLYRVQIHRGGTANASGTVTTPSATFKWSRDNASVITAITAIGSATSSTNATTSQLTVQSIGRDQVLSFKPGDWIEITDDYMELNGAALKGQTGELHQIDTNGVDTTARTITLITPVNPVFATRLSDLTTNYHTRIRRWDQNAGNGKVYQTDGTTLTLWVDLATAGIGQIPVPPRGTALVLENGITVAFDLNPAGGEFLVDDFWTFPARTADGSVGPLSEAPPMGVHHHYARLSVVTFPATATDCRIQWPPPPGTGCCCSVRVSPSEITSVNSLQNILDQYRNLPTETVICLMPGAYPLNTPLRLTSAHTNISLTACPPGTAILSAVPGQESQFGDGLIVLDATSNIALRGLVFTVPVGPFTPVNGQFAGLPLSSFDPDVQQIINELAVSIAVRPFNCTGLTIEECQFNFSAPASQNGNTFPFNIGIFAGGECAEWRVAKNTFTGTQDFAAGILLASSVAFNAPAPVPIPRPGPLPRPVPLRGARSASAASTALKPSADRLLVPPINIGGFGRLQNIFSIGTSVPALAAAGGTVIPSTLDDSVVAENTFTGLTIAVLILGETGALRMLANQVNKCSAGFWNLSPTEAGFLANDLNDVATMVGASVAMGYPPPQGDATSLVTIAAAPASIRIYTGAQAYPDGLGNVWTPDVSSTAVAITGTSVLSQPSPPPTITDAQPTDTDQALYQSERYGSSFSYNFSGLPEGYYQVTLKFAEIVWTAANVRVFDVAINGAQVLTNFDIFAASGGSDIAYDEVLADVAPSNGTITIQFTGTTFGTDSNAKISAVEIESQWGAAFVGSPSTSAANVTEVQNFCAQLVALAEQGFAQLPAMSRMTRITDNVMQGLSSISVLLLGDDSVYNGGASSLMMAGNRLDSTVATTRALNLTTVVAVTDIFQCLLSSNVVICEQINSDFRRALVLNDEALPNPQIAVTGNIFQGSISIFPQRYPASENVPYPMSSWNFMNTVL
jgi:Family of unknown function (DUF6519)/Malectin domain